MRSCRKGVYIKQREIADPVKRVENIFVHGGWCADTVQHTALKRSRLCPGDVLVIGTVSGKSVDPVDLALAAKEAGTYVIGMTSVAYSSMLKSDHSSGKRLFEVVDLVLDDCGLPLDAMVEVPGMDISLCPASGLAAATIMWAIEAAVQEALDDILASEQEVMMQVAELFAETVKCGNT